LALLITAIIGAKSINSDPSPVGELPQTQLEHALEAGQPAVAFFHSLNCDPCIRAMGVVDEVLPEYAGEIVLVDVNVSDTANHSLLRSVGVRMIPAFYFYDRSGEIRVHYGAPHADELREVLNELMDSG
jgi:thioredoxin-like negative regulator of GroEL